MSGVDSRLPTTPRDARRSHLESVWWRRALIAGLRTVPRPVQRASMPLWSSFFYLQVPQVRRAIGINLERLAAGAGERWAIRTGGGAAFRTFSNYCDCVAAAYLYYLGGQAPPVADTTGVEHLEHALAAGRGAILVTGHIGNWQLGPHLLGRDGFPPVTVVMAEEPDAGAQQLEDRLRDRRVRVCYASRSPLIALELRACLERGELVAMQLDRPADRGGIVAPFVGGHARFAAGPAVLARICGSPVVPVFFPTLARRPRICVEPPHTCADSGDRARDLAQLTGALARTYAEYVLSYPEQWYNFYTFWCDG